ncbi:MAG TPA: hypothetical protein VFS56_03075 [Gemmatimonadaceae bacterium]|nr:hypothetical protein [Gemmatimonadaceae bacterium]
MTHRRLMVFALVLAGGSHAGAQGALSTQGLGFPPGQMSTRAEGSGGSTADFDPLSPINPASLSGVGMTSLFLQYAPEFRKVTTGAGSARTTTARFPVFGVVLPLGGTWTAGFSASTFLDRSFETRSQRTEVVGGPEDVVEVTERLRVLGAVNDLRLAMAWAGSPRLRVGAGAHLFTGRNRVTLDQFFADSVRNTSNTQTSVVSYTGLAGSIGVSFHPSRVLGFALSGRKGGELRAQSGDTAVAEATIPDRISAGVTYEGITGATLSARVSHETWSSLAGLSGSAGVFDGWDSSVGAEVSGPRIMQRIVTLRAGGRYRTLPFGVANEKVTETAFMAGFGAPLTRNRATLDFAVQRASRSSSGSVDERGFILSFGLRVSP